MSHFRVYPTPASALQHEAAEIGYAAILMGVTHSHRGRAISYLRHVVEPAIRQRRIKFFFNEDGHVVGYVIWAFLAAEVGQRAEASGEFQLHESEWNEGEEVWIVDFLAPFGNLKYVLADLRDTVFRDVETVRYVRPRQWGLRCGTISRGKRSSFFHTQPVSDLVIPTLPPDRYVRERW